MRTRNQLEPTETSNEVPETVLTVYRNSFQADPDYGDWYGYPNVLDYIVSGSPIGTEGPFGNSSEMSDEVLSGYGIKNVDHIIRHLPRWPRLTHWDPKGVLNWKTSLYAEWQYAGNWLYAESPVPWLLLQRDAQNLGAKNLKTMDVEQQCPISPLPDRLGSLPAAVLRRIEQIHSSTILYEARELPALFRLFKGRGKLMDSLDTLLRMPQLLIKKPGGARKRLLEAIREGILSQQYGIAPTIRDMKSVHDEILGKGRKPRSKEFSVRFRDERVRTQQYKPGGQDAKEATMQYHNGAVIETFTRTRVDGCRVVDRKRPFYNEGWQKAADLIDTWVGRNPLGLAWEILPFSFMVDWFVSVDDVLDTVFLNSQNDLECSYWTSTKVECEQKFDLEICKEIYGHQAVGRQYKWVRPDSGSVRRFASRYIRSRREQPSPLDSTRIRGVTGKNLFLTCLIALGLRSPR